MKGPLGNSYIYVLQNAPDGARLIPQMPESVAVEEGFVIGVINPVLFELFGKKMRIAFLTVDNYSGVEEQIKNCNFETLALLGQHDLLVTHLHENRYDMIYDITQAIPLRMPINVRPPSDKLSDDAVEANFPFYRVDVFYKVLGIPVTSLDRSVFDSPDKPIPTQKEITEMLKLAQNWSDETVSDQAREKFIERKWILGTTSRKPGSANAIMTIFLDLAGPQVLDLFASFDENVVPFLVENPSITSLYRGRAQGLAIHYLLRITSDTESLYKLIGEINNLAVKARLLITTSTSLVIRKLSALSLEKAVLLPILPSDEKYYRDHAFLPMLSDEDRVRAIYLPEAEQRILIMQYRKVAEAISQVAVLPSFREKITDIEKKIAKGLLHGEFMLLREAHDALQIRVEISLRDFIERNITNEQLDDWRADLHLVSGKGKSALSFSERIRLVTRFIEETGMYAELLNSLKNLIRTLRVRNAFAHSDWERLTIEDYVETIPIYTDFLSIWDTDSL
jgi:hypothetical protein